MTGDEAIKILSNTNFFTPSMNVEEAVNVAIKALKEQETLLNQIEALEKENGFLKKIQQGLIENMSNEQLGKIVHQALKNKF